MAASLAKISSADSRSESRDEVYHRTRVIAPDGRALPLLIVNISAHGLMARCDMDYDVGQLLRVDLPLLGRVAAEVRWSLGGRIGCQLVHPIPLAKYYAVLAAMA